MTHILDGVVEPYPPRTLEALEYILKNATEPQLKVNAAMLLYRYDRANGKQHLVSILDSPAVEGVKRQVVLSFALNHEADAIAQIAASLLQIGRPNTETLTALGRWHMPEIDQAFRQKAASDRKSTRLNSSHSQQSRMPSSA